jgi:hypothetical protein
MEWTPPLLSAQKMTRLISRFRELRHFRPPFVMSDLVFLLRNDGMAGKSPLKAKPLRNPGDSVDEEIDRHINGREGSVTRED